MTDGSRRGAAAAPETAASNINRNLITILTRGGVVKLAICDQSTFLGTTGSPIPGIRHLALKGFELEVCRLHCEKRAFRQLCTVQVERRDIEPSVRECALVSQAVASLALEQFGQDLG